MIKKDLLTVLKLAGEYAVYSIKGNVINLDILINKLQFLLF